MERINVVSSNIVSVGYDASSSILEVEFNQGRVYHYFDVPQSHYDNLMSAQSHGEYLSKYIKGTYRYNLIS